MDRWVKRDAEKRIISLHGLHLPDEMGRGLGDGRGRKREGLCHAPPA